MNDQPSGRSWLRRIWDEWDREFFVKRSLLLLIAGPTGALLGGAGAAADAGEIWWPWWAGGIAWLVLSSLGSIVIWAVVFTGRPSHARRR